MSGWGLSGLFMPSKKSQAPAKLSAPKEKQNAKPYIISSVAPYPPKNVKPPKQKSQASTPKKFQAKPPRPQKKSGCLKKTTYLSQILFTVEIFIL